MIEWKESDYKCPKCKQKTEIEIIEIDEIRYDNAERCKKCGWKINFNE